MSRFKVFGAFVSALALAALLASQAFAWTPPAVTSPCAPDASHVALVVTLSGDEPDYNFEWSYGPNGPWTFVKGVLGDNNLVIPRGDGDVFVRWASDHTSIGSVTPNTNLCVQPTPTPTPKHTPKPTHKPVITPPSTGTLAPTQPNSGSGSEVAFIAILFLAAAGTGVWNFKFSGRRAKIRN